MTSFEPVDRREIARHTRRFPGSRGGRSDGRPLDDVAAPEIEDLGGATRASSGFDRRAAVAIAVVAALVTFGFAGRMSGPAPAAVPASTGRPVTAVATTPSSRPALELVGATAGTTAGGPVATVVLRADRAVGPVELSLAAGSHLLGTMTIDVTSPGQFSAAIPVGVLPFTIDATLRVSPTRPDAGSRLVLPVRLEPPAAVILSSVHLLSADPDAHDRRLAIEGFASSRINDLGVALVSDRAEPVATVPASFSGDSIGWGGVMLGGRPFSASLDGSRLRPGVPIRVVLTWFDLASGATASTERILVPPERSPDTIAPNGTWQLPWTTAED